jgi:DNA-binding PucR family transcriptional regulator
LRRTAVTTSACSAAFRGNHRDPVLVEEHLDTVIVHRDPRLLDLLREQYLAPLDDASPASRLMLRETLRSWLRNMGDRAAMAEELHVHRQTVRYRLGRLSELFGSALQDPDQRARLMLGPHGNPPVPH